MNRLADLLIELNKQRLDDEYIEKEVELFIQDLKLELGAEIIPEITMLTQESETPPVFCVCPDDMRDLCKHKNHCINGYA